MSNGDAEGGTAAALIGVDVGGTHTDVAVAVGGRIERGKALTTYDDFSRGVLEAVAVAADKHGLELGALLQATQLFINGTTVVTNAIAEMRGSRVGVLMTAGNPDVFRIAGGPRTPEIDDHLQVNVPELVSREAIAEIHERVDWSGAVIVPLDIEEVERETRRLVEEVGVDALAICFLWSHMNGDHENAARAAVAELYPDLFVTASHHVFPVQGETRRWTTAVLNSFVQDRTEVYLTSVSEKLRGAGLSGGLAFFQGLGGGIGFERARGYPLALLGSGPAAGAIGANELAKRMGVSGVLLGDMGGTSFDTGLISENETQIAKNLDIGPFQTGVNVVDVISVGAGGGSIGWVSERGVPQVGPRSARSTPGPAALGRGGVEPTVTDAMVTMGFIETGGYLGGRIELRPDLAREALDRTFGQAFGWTPEESAAAMHDLVVANMANAVQEVTVGKGHDPRNFMFLAYGGTLPMFASQIAEQLEIDTIVIPQNSSVFCALGLLSSDFMMRFDQGVSWSLDRPEGVDQVNEVARSMAAKARAAMESEGFAEPETELRRSAEFRFQGQDYELSLPMPAEDLVAGDAPKLFDRFFGEYEKTYGVGTAWKGVPASMVTYSVTAIGRRPHPVHDAAAAKGQAAPEAATRLVYLPESRSREEIPVYQDIELGGDSGELQGPAIIDAHDTTIYVPSGSRVRRDEYMNYILTR